ncbi:MAG: HD domain-containing phosphohydrolase [Acidimicrobiales bacterium]
MTSSGVRLADLMVALSLATDLGLGQPAEHMVRAARIGLRLGERLGLEDAALAAVYDVNLLTYVGCPVYGNESALVFGDDIEFRARAEAVDRRGFSALRLMLSQAGAGTSPVNRVRQAAHIMVTQGKEVIEQMANHCAAGGELANRLGLGDEVQAGVQQSYARWDGQGVPAGLAGDSLSLPARVAHVAEACEFFQRTASVDEAVAMTQARRGTHFDPAIVDAVVRDPAPLFEGLGAAVADDVVAADPAARQPLSDDELDQALEAIADFCDLRCGFFAGHGRGTAELVAGAVAKLNVAPAEANIARRAALVHDVGRFGVSGAVWSRPGPLSGPDLERMRLHVYYVERIFSRLEPLRRVGLLAASHHERLDGSGYHRGVGATMLSTSARVLGAADAYHAMLQPRPYRPARTAEKAARELRADADAGRLDPAAVDAVLTVAGHAASRTRAGGPAGLTVRESEVLALLAVGMPNKAIARNLGISPKTVSNHIERIYVKLAVSNRASAAMRAMQYGLLDGAPAQQPT